MRRIATWLACVAGALLVQSAQAADTPDTLSARAFEDAQMATSTKTAIAFAQSSARLAANDPALAELLRTRQDAETRWRAIDDELVAARGRGDTVTAANLTGLLDKTAEEIRGYDRDIAIRFPDFAELTDAAPAALRSVQALLGPDDALVFIVPAFDGTYIWAVRRDRAVWRRGVMGDAEVKAAVGELRAALDPGGASRAAIDASGQGTLASHGFPRAKAYALYQSVWGPVDEALAGAKNVYVVATGALSALPLAVLPTAAPQGDDAEPTAMRQTPWLFERYALATLPSVASLKAVRRAAAAATGKREKGPAFAGFGDPALADADAPAAPRGFDAYYRDGRADPGAVKSLPSLPGTRTELFALAKALKAPKASVVSGPAATEAAVKRADLSTTRVIAFATHGLLAGDLDGLAEPALVFTPPAEPSPLDDGLLTASEAASLKLSADWVVLSACNTAAPDGRGGFEAGGEGLSGLARGFFHAGARSLLVSHWRVRDDAAARLTTSAIRWYARDPRLGRAGALRKAMMEMLFDRKHPEFAQPSYWAPFVVAGEAG